MMTWTTCTRLQKVPLLVITVISQTLICPFVFFSGLSSQVQAQPAKPTVSTLVPPSQPTSRPPRKGQAATQRQPDIKFIPPPLPDRGAPGRGIGAASRGHCPAVNQPLAALVPVTKVSASEKIAGKAQGGPSAILSTESVWGLTAAEHPSFWFYVPYSSEARGSGEFVLQNEQGDYIYKTTFGMGGTSPGIVSLHLPSTVPSLVPGKRYHWFFLVNCDPDAPAFVEGWIQRVVLSPSLMHQLEVAPPRQRVALYTAHSIWYDALSTLAELHQAQPEDASLTDQWTRLLQQINLGSISSEPIVQCCQLSNQATR